MRTSIVLPFFFVVGCSECGYIPVVYEASNAVGICKGLKDGKKSESSGVTSDSVVVTSASLGSGILTIVGSNLNKIKSGKVKKDNDEIGLSLDSQTDSQISFKFPASRNLLNGLWGLVLSEAQADNTVNIYLDVQDNTITDAKIVSVAASKITGTLSAANIPSLSSVYAQLTSGKISSSVIPDLSSSYATLTSGKVSSSVIPDLSSNYAALSSGKVTSSVIPDLSSNYAPLTSGKVSASVIPDISSTYSIAAHTHSGVYAAVSHSHTASDVGAVATSVGAGDAGKVVKLNSSGTIDSTLYQRGARSFIRFTRTNISNSASLATKDAQCQSEFGSDFKTATQYDGQFYLSVAGGAWISEAGSAQAGTVSSVGGGGYALGITFDAGTTYPLFCISNQAPYRFSRTDISPSSSDATKDSTCSSDHGSNYVAGSMNEFAMAAGFVSEFGGFVFIGQSVLQKITFDGTYRRSLFATNGTSNGRVFCLRAN